MASRLNLISNHLSAVSREARVEPKYLKDPIEFLQLEELLPPDVNSRRKLLREMLEREVAPMLPEYIEKAQFPMQVLPKIRHLFGLDQAQYGCKQIGSLERHLILYEIARIDCSLATFYAMTTCLVMYTIERLGSEEQKAKYLPALCSLETIGCWGLTEPNFGSDASSLQTSATPVDGGFLISGEKRWIGNAIMSDIMIIWARNTQTKQVEGFIIPTKTPGVRVENIKHKLGLRMVQNGHIFLNDVKVGINSRLEKATNFVNGANVVLEHSRISIPWIATGIMSGIYEVSVKYLRERKQFDLPLGAFQLNQEKLVRILGYYQSSFLLSWRIAKLQESGKANIAQASLIKGWTTYVGREVARLGRELLGGNGIIIDNYVIKALTDMEVIYTYEGTYDINTLVAGRAITGFSAFKTSYKST